MAAGLAAAALLKLVAAQHWNAVPAVRQPPPLDLPSAVPLWNAGGCAASHGVFLLAEGYQASALDDFVADAQRLVREAVIEPRGAFRAFRGLLSVVAVPVASARVGVGVGSAGDTAFGVFRERGTLRSLLPSDGTYKRAREVCEAAARSVGCRCGALCAPCKCHWGGVTEPIAVATSQSSSLMTRFTEGWGTRCPSCRRRGQGGTSARRPCTVLTQRCLSRAVEGSRSATSWRTRWGTWGRSTTHQGATTRAGTSHSSRGGAGGQRYAGLGGDIGA